MKNLYRETPEHKEITQRTTRTEGMYTENHQNTKESTQRHQIRSYTAIAQNKSYTERH